MGSTGFPSYRAGSIDISLEEKDGRGHHSGAGATQLQLGGDDEYPDGGYRAWLVAAGAATIFFATLGYSNSFGVFQAFYKTQLLQDETPDNIAWIGSIQGFLMFAAGSVGGPLADRYGVSVVICPSAVSYVLAIMLTSVCKAYWQLMLAQGILTGISSGLLCFPSMAIVSQYFQKKRAAALGIAISGSSIGGVVLPIILSKMLNSSTLGFGWSVRVIGFIVIPFLAFSCLVVKSRLPPRKTNPIVWAAFKNPTFNILAAATFFMLNGMYTPLFFMPSYGISQGMDATLASYLLAMLNGASTFGRIIPGLLADRYGRLNIFSLAGLSSGIIILCLTKVHTDAALIIYSIVFGFFSGAIISSGATAFSVTCKDPREIGAYMGMGMGFGSLATLIGPPVNGAMIKIYDGFLEVSIFSGVLCLVGGSLAFMTKMTTPKGLWGSI